MICQIVGSFAAVAAFSILLEVPKKYVVFTGLAGTAGWAAYLILKALQYSEVISNFWAALVIALISHTFARIFKAPVTAFLIGGILPIVPGAGMYKIVHHMILGQTGSASYYLAETLMIAGMIALGIFIMDSLFKVLQFRRKDGNNQ